MIIGQDVYHAIGLLRDLAAEEKCSLFAFRMSIGWILKWPLTSIFKFAHDFFQS